MNTYVNEELNTVFLLVHRGFKMALAVPVGAWSVSF